MVKERLFFLFVGIIFQWIVVGIFDYVLYPFVVWKFGLLNGGLAMATVSLVFCSATLAFYNSTKKDWFGIEMAKKLREYDGTRMVPRVISWMLKKSKAVLFVFLSVRFDPFTTVVYMRRGSNTFPAINSKDLKIFFASWLIGNLSWLITVYAGVSATEYTWKIFFRT